MRQFQIVTLLVAFFRPSSKKTTLIFVFWQRFWGPDGVNYGAKNSLDLKGLDKPIGEVQICRILTNRAIIWAYSPQEQKTDGFTRFIRKSR